MSAPVVTIVNNRGGVGKTSLVYHLAWMYADRGHRVVVADLDPQANLTAAFFTDEEVADLWTGPVRRTVWGSIKPFQEGAGGILPAPLSPTGNERLAVVPGDLNLSSFEDDLSHHWARAVDGDPRAFRVLGALWGLLASAAEQHDADLVLVDVGPSLGALNRAALISSDHVIVPMAPDLFSVQALENLGPTLRRWRTEWRRRLESRPEGLPLPTGAMNPLGYVVLGHGVRLGRPVQAYQRWMDQIPGTFRHAVLDRSGADAPPVERDPYCLAQLKHYRSLMPLAQEARKPMFALKPADGAFGGHAQAAQWAYFDFRLLAEAILARIAAHDPT